MRYTITDITISKDSSMTKAYASAGGVFGSRPSNPVHVDLTLEVFEYDSIELSSVEEFEKALKNDIKLSPDAPSYLELLKKYHPEFLL